MDTNTFAEKIKTKYPEYNNLDNVTLTQKIVEKYPVYRSQITDFTEPNKVGTDTGNDIKEIGTGIKENFQKNQNAAKQTVADYKAGKQGLGSSILQSVGQAANVVGGAIGDTAIGIGKAVLPQSGEDLIARGAADVAHTIQNDEGAQKVSAGYKSWAEKHPEASKDLGAVVDIASLIPIDEAVGIAGKVATKTGKALNTAGNVIKETTEGVASKVVKQTGLKAATTPEEIFAKNLSDAEKSIYPKLTPSEKQTIKLKDTKSAGGLLGDKSVPDLINEPKTKGIIESVANLPDDIKVKPTDTVAVKESKLDQGISRLHQETDSYLAQPEIKTKTQFKTKDFDSYMEEKVLGPIENEFGKTSEEYQAAKKSIATAKSQLESTDAHGVHRARQKFNQQFESENPRAYKKAKGSFGSQLDPKTDAIIEAGRETSAALRDFTQDLLDVNDPFRSRLKNESNLIRAKEEMRTRSTGQLDKNAGARYLDRNPNTKKAVNAVAGAVKVGTGVNILKGL